MSRPPGPKRLAALEQLDAMRKQGVPEHEIRQALLMSGLTRQQVNDILPVPVITVAPVVVTPDAKLAVLEGSIHFLESIAKRITPGMADRFPDLGIVKSDALTWSRKVKGAL